MKKLYPIFLLFLCCAGSFANAQDMGYTQFLGNRLVLNPAYIAKLEGTNIMGIGRAQYLRMPNRPVSFGKFNLSGSTELAPRFSMGIDIGLHTEGEGRLQNWNYAIMTGYFLPVQTEQGVVKKAFSFGINGSYNVQRIDWSKLIFLDQIDPSLGVVTPVSPGAMQPEAGKAYFDSDLGILYSQTMGEYSQFDVGFAAQHIIRPDNSIQNLNSIIPMHYSFHASGSFLTNPHNHYADFLYINPAFKFDLQSQFRSITVGADLIYVPVTHSGRKQMSTYKSVFTGIYLQSRNFVPDAKNTAALSVLGGYKIKGNTTTGVFTLSYEFNIGGLNHTNSHGTVELSANFNWDKGLFSKANKIGKGKPPVKCPNSQGGR